jgi:hypothetical protein
MTTPGPVLHVDDEAALAQRLAVALGCARPEQESPLLADMRQDMAVPSV